MNAPAQAKGHERFFAIISASNFSLTVIDAFSILGVLSLVATDLAGIAMPWLIKGGIDTALHGTGEARSLVKYPLLILGAAALQGFFRYCWRINIHGFSRRCEADLRDRVFTHLQKLPLGYFQHTKTGDLMSRLTNDIQAVRELMGFGSLAIVDAVVVIFFSLTLMITIDPWLSSVVDAGYAADSDRRAFFRPANFSLVARHPGTAECSERLRSGKSLRHPRGAGLRPRAKPDSTASPPSAPITGAKTCGWRRSGGSSGR